jgi:hypothetical protein
MFLVDQRVDCARRNDHQPAKHEARRGPTEREHHEDAVEDVTEDEQGQEDFNSRLKVRNRVFYFQQN